MKAVLKNYRQSPRKVRLIADLVRGKKVDVALAQLQFVDKRAAGPVAKVILSAKANALKTGIAPETLIIKKVTVDKGVPSDALCHEPVVQPRQLINAVVTLPSSSVLSKEIL